MYVDYSAAEVKLCFVYLTDCVHQTDKASSGVASIIVSEDGKQTVIDYSTCNEVSSESNKLFLSNVPQNQVRIYTCVDEHFVFPKLYNETENY